MRRVLAWGLVRAARRAGDAHARGCKFPPRCVAHFSQTLNPEGPVSPGWDSRTLSTSRLMLPDDANPNGNVHGGTTLKMIAQAGYVVACRHANSNAVPKDANDPTIPVIPMMAHLDEVHFEQPVHVGELVQLYATLGFTSRHTIEVDVVMEAENLVTRRRRRTNTARVTYVGATPTLGLTSQNKVRAAEVPQLVPRNEKEQALFEAGQARYEARKAELRSRRESSSSAFRILEDEAQVSLVEVMMPGDCVSGKYVQAGVLMKLMDNAAGCAAIKHCGAIAVTAKIDALNFDHSVLVGDLVYIHASPVFASNKTVEIGVSVEIERTGLTSKGQRLQISYGAFSMVAIDPKTRRSMPVPPVVPKTPGQQQAWERAKARYEARKKVSVPRN
eukprot:RCo026835